MTRTRTTLEYLNDESQRKATFKKRSNGLIKKVSELSTLCGVQACAIINSPYGQEPMVWPSPHEAQAVLDRFKKLPDTQQTRRMFDQENHTRYRLENVQDEFRHLQIENKRKEMEIFMHKCISGQASLNDFDFRNANEMRHVIDKTQEMIRSRLEALQGANVPSSDAMTRDVAKL